MAVEITFTVPDWQFDKAYGSLLGAGLLFIRDPEPEQLSEQPEDRLAPTDSPQVVVDPERPELDCAEPRALPTPQREAV